MEELGENARRPADMDGNVVAKEVAQCHAEPDDLGTPTGRPDG